jgi:hypothetical protein
MNSYIYIVMEDDGATCGSFLDQEMAMKFKNRLEQEFGPKFSINTVLYGPRGDLAYLLNDND